MFIYRLKLLVTLNVLIENNQLVLARKQISSTPTLLKGSQSHLGP